ncbi:MAG: hypothetical protein OQL27_02530 [Sedimenticola sp.]|nr:hypothetical protein [Sedimenticola sp.]
MRVAMFFVAFGFLFAFVIPQMVSTFLANDDDQVAWQLMQGADPTEILQETAAGVSESLCAPEGYSYYQSSDGQPFVKKDKSQYVAALIDDNLMFFKLTESDKAVALTEDGQDIVENTQTLEVILHDCTQSKLEPIASPLKLSVQ